MMRRRLRSAYLSTVLSISLVLLLVGVASLLLVNARGVSDYFKEHMQISVLMKPDISDAQTLEYQVELDAMDFVLSTEFISKAQGTREMEQMLEKISEFCRLDLNTRAERIRALLPPLALLFFGGTVGFILFSAVLPLLDSMTAFM